MTEQSRWQVALSPGATEVENFAATYLDRQIAGTRVSNHDASALADEVERLEERLSPLEQMADDYLRRRAK